MGNNNSAATNKKHDGSEIDQLESLFSGSAPPELPALQRVFEKLRGEKSDSIQTSGLEVSFAIAALILHSWSWTFVHVHRMHLSSSSVVE